MLTAQYDEQVTNGKKGYIHSRRRRYEQYKLAQMNVNRTLVPPCLSVPLCISWEIPKHFR